MKIFVSEDGRVFEVIEKTIEIPYWSPLGRQVQISTTYEFRDTGERCHDTDRPPLPDC